MAEEAKSDGRGSKSPRRTAEADDATRLRVETELRNHLAGRDPEFALAVLGRVGLVRGPSAAAAAGVSVASGPASARALDAAFDGAARALTDEAGLAERVTSLHEISRVTLALLAAHPWWSRTALVQAVAMLRGGDGDPELTGRGVAEVLSRWPVLVRTNTWTRTEELSLFEPLSLRLRPLLEGALAVGREKGPPLGAVGLGRTLLALALFPGLVAQRRPRVTRGGELHAADATKLERALGDARGLFGTWARLGAFEEVDGALSPVVGRVRRLLDDPARLVSELLEQRLGDLGWALASLAARADEGDRLELGAALLAVGLRANLGFGLDVPSLASRIEREDLRFDPLLLVDPKEDVLAIPSEVRAAIRGEPLAVAGGPSATGFVQPNYEVLVPPGVPLGAAFVIGCAAELVHFEAVARLRLTRESVLSARGVGLDVGEVIAALETVAGTRGLPPAVRHAMEEWGASVGEARVRTAVLLDVKASPTLLESVAERLAAIVVDRPTPNLFVLSRAPSPKELSLLRAAGVLVRAVSAGSPRHEHEHEEDRDETPLDAPYPIADGRAPSRNLRRALDPHRVLALVEASRPRRAQQPTGTPPGRGALDDDGAERPIPRAVDVALDERRVAWSARADWTRQLDQIVESSSFRRAAAFNPGALSLAVRRAGEPQRLQLEVARIVAEASVRRAAD